MAKSRDFNARAGRVLATETNTRRAANSNDNFEPGCMPPESCWVAERVSCGWQGQHTFHGNYNCCLKRSRTKDPRGNIRGFLCPSRRVSGATAAAAAVQQRSDVWIALSTLLNSSCCSHIRMCVGYVLPQYLYNSTYLIRYVSEDTYYDYQYCRSHSRSPWAVWKAQLLALSLTSIFHHNAATNILSIT